MNTKVVKDIIEFTLNNIDWQDEDMMKCVVAMLNESVNTVIGLTEVVAIPQCNLHNNTQKDLDDGKLVVDVLLIDACDLTAKLIRTRATYVCGVVTTTFQEINR